jgi:hypothetical protein
MCVFRILRTGDESESQFAGEVEEEWVEVDEEEQCS